MKDNFERCLAHTLKWEGGYSNHPDDPGGATMKGVTQAVYNSWRKSKNRSRRDVKKITDEEVKSIYRENYWEPCDCDSLPNGLDLCVFDAAVNSGPARATTWLHAGTDIESFSAIRLEFLKRLRTWRVFGRGWERRVNGVLAEAKRMSGGEAIEQDADKTLHAGIRSPAVRRLQVKLRALGYPAGRIDGIYGDQTYRAVLLFQNDNDLSGEKGVWQPEYWPVLNQAEPVLPQRKQATHKDLEQQGDRPTHRMNLLQRIFAWVFGASAVAQVSESTSVLQTFDAMKAVFEPALSLLSWVSSNKWLLIAAGSVFLIMLVRWLRAQHVNAYRHFDYQGEFKAVTATEGA